MKYENASINFKHLLLSVYVDRLVVGSVYMNVVSRWYQNQPVALERLLKKVIKNAHKCKFD